MELSLQYWICILLPIGLIVWNRGKILTFLVNSMEAVSKMSQAETDAICGLTFTGGLSALIASICIYNQYIAEVNEVKYQEVQRYVDQHPELIALAQKYMKDEYLTRSEYFAIKKAADRTTLTFMSDKNERNTSAARQALVQQLSANHEASKPRN